MIWFVRIYWKLILKIGLIYIIKVNIFLVILIILRFVFVWRVMRCVRILGKFFKVYVRYIRLELILDLVLGLVLRVLNKDKEKMKIF